MNEIAFGNLIFKSFPYFCMINHALKPFILFMNDNPFEITPSASDKAIAQCMGAFVRHHRMEHNKTQDQLAASAGISRSTLSLLERGETVTVSTLIQVLRVLDQLPVLGAFELRPVISPLALAKQQKKIRRRARNKTGREAKNEDSNW